MMNPLRFTVPGFDIGQVSAAAVKDEDDSAARESSLQLIFALLTTACACWLM